MQKIYEQQINKYFKIVFKCLFFHVNILYAFGSKYYLYAT